MTAECEHKSFVIGWPEYHGGAEWCCVDCGRPRKAVRPELEPAEVIRSLEDIIAALREAAVEREALWLTAQAQWIAERNELRTRAERAERALEDLRKLRNDTFERNHERWGIREALGGQP